MSACLINKIFHPGPNLLYIQTHMGRHFSLHLARWTEKILEFFIVQQGNIVQLLDQCYLDYSQLF